MSGATLCQAPRGIGGISGNSQRDRSGPPHIEVLATRRPYVIAGRTVLRHFVVRVDGPRELVELRRPR